MKPSQSPISTANIGRALTLHGNESRSQIHSFPLFTGERVSRDAPIPPFRRRRLPSLSPFSETSPPPRYTRFHHLQKIEFPRDAPIPPFRRRRLPSLSPFSETSPAPRYTRFHHLQENELPATPRSRHSAIGDRSRSRKRVPLPDTLVSTICRKSSIPRDAPTPPFRRLTSPSPFTETSPPPRYTRFHHLPEIELPPDAPNPPFRHRAPTSPSPFPETSPAPRYTRFHHLQNRASP